MRVAIYDKNPGSDFGSKFLAFMWLVGCFLHKLFGKLDAYRACTSWSDAIAWLTVLPKPLASIQFWGHGDPGGVWIGNSRAIENTLLPLKQMLTKDSVVWFRACSVFQGQRGWDFSKNLADGLGCTIAGHTRIIGILQSGLHTRKPNSLPSWPLAEGELPGFLASQGLGLGNNTIVCLRATIPEGW